MKRIRRIAAAAAVVLFILSCGLFASAEQDISIGIRNYIVTTTPTAYPVVGSFIEDKYYSFMVLGDTTDVSVLLKSPDNLISQGLTYDVSWLVDSSLNNVLTASAYYVFSGSVYRVFDFNDTVSTVNINGRVFYQYTFSVTVPVLDSPTNGAIYFELYFDDHIPNVETMIYAPEIIAYSDSDQIIDDIIGGDGTPLAPDPGADEAMDEIEAAEDAALGGKTDEEIQQDVDNALSFDLNTLDQNAAVAMAGYFDNLLSHFGVDYQALLLLSLSLGLAAFIIGRRYTA